MGDRANVCVKGEDGPPVFFYTHWRGTELPGIVARGLDRGRDRWGDTPYLRRVVFCELVAADVDGLAGFGISSSIGDNEYAILVVDDTKKTVGVALEGTPESPFRTASYEEFIANPDVLPRKPRR